jgi:O-antigen/teichoic acid export membrane protein
MTNFFFTSLIHNKSSIFVVTSLCAKITAAFAQLYAIYVFTKMQSDSEAALIFLLSGYAIWFQVFELGLSQTFQNKFNDGRIQAQEIMRVIIAHYIFLGLLGIFIVSTPYLSNILLPPDKQGLNNINHQAFSLGASILILATSNVLVQRFLLIMNKGLIGNCLLIIQSALAIGFLYLYQFFEVKNLLIAVSAYFGPQILVFIPVLVVLILKFRKKTINKAEFSLIKLFHDSLGFCGVGILSAIFLGSDYYFAAHYLSDTEVISYYFVTRIFFISFVIYYGYLVHQVRHISSEDLILNKKGIVLVVKNCMKIGQLCVAATFCISIFLNEWGFSMFLINQSSVDWTLLVFGFLYFGVRVCRDVGVVLMSSLDEKKILYQVYLLEISIGLTLMFFLVPVFAGVGIFLSMMMSCFLSTIFLLIKFPILKGGFEKS